MHREMRKNKEIFKCIDESLCIMRKVYSLKQYRACSSFISKTMGAMFRFSISKPLLFFFPREKPIRVHMWFVFTSLRIVYLSSEKKVVAVQQLKPFS